VSIHDSPAVFLTTNHTGNPQRNRGELLAAADLCAVSLDFNDARQVRGCIGCDSFEAHDLTVSIKRCGLGDGF
jgi:hypothetical protein